MELRDALASRFGTWNEDLSPAWRRFFRGADVDPAAVPDGLPLGTDEAQAEIEAHLVEAV